MNNARLIHKFYSSFRQGDAKSMAECYDKEIVFRDPAFGELKGENVNKMWRMLIERSKGDLKIEFTDIKADETRGSAKWIATYTFSQTGRQVRNCIQAHFIFSEGKIIRHTDHFSLWKWSRQALGWKGWLMGWTPFLRNKIQRQTNGLLMKYRES